MKSAVRLLFIPLLVLSLLLGGCAVKPKTFEKEGFSITLSNKYSEFQNDGCVAAYESRKGVVLISKESFEELKDHELDASNTPGAYAKLIISVNELGEIEVQESDGKTYFNYQQTVHKTQYSYLAYVIKDSTGFWMVQFACRTRDYNELESSFHEFFDSFTLTES